MGIRDDRDDNDIGNQGKSKELKDK